MTVHAHFDGKAIIPDEPLCMPPNQALILQQPANPQIKREAMEKQRKGNEVFAAGLGKPNPKMDAAQNRAGEIIQVPPRWLPQDDQDPR